jgi:entericidin B
MQGNRRYLLLLAVLWPLLLSGCNTISGLGQDMEAAGDAMDREAEERKNY